jgi:hypothetical protein
MGERLVGPGICLFNLAQILCRELIIKWKTIYCRKSNPRHTLEFVVKKTLIRRSHDGTKIVRGLYPEKLPSKEVGTSELRKKIKADRK